MKCLICGRSSNKMIICIDNGVVRCFCRSHVPKRGGDLFTWFMVKVLGFDI